LPLSLTLPLLLPLSLLLRLPLLLPAIRLQLPLPPALSMRCRSRR
jgi:hypothetical protein